MSGYLNYHSLNTSRSSTHAPPRSGAFPCCQNRHQLSYLPRLQPLERYKYSLSPPNFLSFLHSSLLNPLGPHYTPWLPGHTHYFLNLLSFSFIFNICLLLSSDRGNPEDSGGSL